jgi:hypothetical protein
MPRLFDQLGWRWTYEPIDLAGWIPDFWHRDRNRRPVLVCAVARRRAVPSSPFTKPRHTLDLYHRRRDRFYDGINYRE